MVKLGTRARIKDKIINKEQIKATFIRSVEDCDERTYTKRRKFYPFLL
jgi:hypothetical protein